MGDLSQLGGDQHDQGDIAVETFAVAEGAAEEVVRCVHSTLDSEEKRKDVIEYIQRLISDKLGVEVLPYGSVPLKTYLPDGDIDLTALSSPTAMDTLPYRVLDVLQCVENEEDSGYKVRGAHFINAEVKLVKCLVQNIVVDLSFNQLGGLRALCFLEQVDRRVGKNHLFKRSIILVKTWCYYESRILGAHHGLISTYAMETLVLYIFHLYQASLDGPLEALHKFLEYFSKFDWDNYCISLSGPVKKSCLPDIVVDMEHNMQNDDGLDEESLRKCVDMFSVPFREADTSPKVFPIKYLNIIDPLNENNNLGRSVSRGNFYRIRSAFKYGARKLGKIFTLPRDKIGDEIRRFFGNTFERHRRHGKNITLSSNSSLFSEQKFQFNSLSLCSESHTENGNFEVTEINHFSMDQSMGEMSISGSVPAGEMCLGPPNYQLNCSESACYPSDSVFQYSQSFADNGTLESWMNKIPEKADSDLFIGKQRNNHLRPCGVGCHHSDNYDYVCIYRPGIMSPHESMSEDLGLDVCDKDLVDAIESPENSNPLSDLSGDYDSHIRSLFYGQCCYVNASSDSLTKHHPPTFAPQLEKKPSETAGRSMSSNYCSSDSIDNVLTDYEVNLGWALQPCIVPEQWNQALCIEEKCNKSRGTGAYFPNDCAYPERASLARGRYCERGNNRKSQRPRSAPILLEKKPSNEGGTSHEQLPRAPCNVEKTEMPQQFCASADDKCQTSDPVPSLQKFEFGSLGNLSDSRNTRALENSSGWCSIKQGKNLESASNHERPGNKLHRLKDEDFPPLTA